MQETLDGWFHATANWSVMDCFAVLAGLFAVWYAFVMIRFYWRNRRIPVRSDAPTHKPWIRAKSFRR